MREIKFRGKRVDNGDWIYGFYLKAVSRFIAVDAGIVDGHFKLREVIPETVCQYTGLKDKNGKEIYEGDIVKGFAVDRQEDCQEINRGVVIFSFCDYIVNYREGSARGFYYLHNMLVDYLEVIGNIYENPELVGGEEC